MAIAVTPSYGDDAPAPGDRVDLAVFAKTTIEGSAITAEWENLREVHEVRIVFSPGPQVPTVNSLRLEWWGSIWPCNGRGGWQRMDDPWNGRWVRTAAEIEKGPGADNLTFRFPALTKEEWKQALEQDQYPDKKTPTFRGTLKIRVVADGHPMPPGTRLMAFGRSRWGEARFDVDVRAGAAGSVAARIEVINGAIADLKSLDAPRAVRLDRTNWTAQPGIGGSAGARLHVRFVQNDDRNSNDLTRVTVRLGDGPGATGFSFVPQDVLSEGPMRLWALGVLVAESSRGLSWANDPGPTGPRWERTLRQRIPERPEASYESAMAGIPRLTLPQWVPLGAPSARQEVFVDPNGNWAMWMGSLHTDARDTQKIPFRQKGERRQGRLETILDTRAEPTFDGGDRQDLVRYLEEDWLPLIHAEWQTGLIRYRHSIGATILLGELGDDEARRGDETVVMLSKLELVNTTDHVEPATVNVRWSHGAPLKLNDDGTIAIAPNDSSAVIPAKTTTLRGQLASDSPNGGIDGWTLKPASAENTSQVLTWQATLAPRATRSLYFKAPYVDLLDETELQRFREMSYEQEVPRMLDYWRERLASAMRFDVPEPALTRFYGANLWHNIITTDRDPETGLYNQFVGTHGYKVFANETIMIARSMDMRGEHREAERFIEPMLHFQGHEALTGRFSTKEGALHSAGAYTHGQYAMNHGFVLWGAADHYLMTRDRAYLERIAPKLIQGCDFLFRERQSTMAASGEPRPPWHGLAPASSLEDVIEFQYWLATNGYFHLGLKRVAEALADINHPDAARIARETESYRRDIEIAAREATTRAAAVRLRDGSFVPYVPPSVLQWQHLTSGWIREALYCSLHLGTTEVVSYDDPLMTWMLDELEDNIFFSGASGYGVRDVDAVWFERGGLTPQPCLLDTPLAYMARDEIPAALRSFWNTYALLIHNDTQCFAEWAPAFGVPGGPLYKTSDESRFIMWMRQLLICEDGERLLLGRAAPRAWLEEGKTIRVERAPTWFGPVSLLIRSDLLRGRILAKCTLPTRQPPKEVCLRLRHPLGKHPVRVFVDEIRLAADRVNGEDILLPLDAIDASRPVDVRAEYDD